MRLMRRILKKIGLIFLKWSGYDIPEEVIKRVVEPVVVSTTYSLYTDVHKYVADSFREKKIKELMTHAQGYIKTDVTINDGIISTTLSLIIQRPDPKGR